MERSKTFCILPFLQLATKPDGTLNPCCLTSQVVLRDQSGQALRLDQNSVGEIWNSGILRAMRRDMLAGHPLSECDVCYRDEAADKWSLRQNMNEKWESHLGSENIAVRVREARDGGGELKAPPVYLDLRLGNKCNLKCRMCFPVNSHALNHELQSIIASGQPYPADRRREVLPAGKPLTWGESQMFLRNMDELLPYLEEMYFTGGEPMLVPGTVDILQKAVGTGVASKIQITFHTNTTVFNPKVVELFRHFKAVCLNCSIDGAGAVDDYIRYPTNFEIVNANFDRYLKLTDELENLSLALATAVSWQNVFNLPDLMTWYASKKTSQNIRFLGLFVNMVHYPSYLSLKMVPKALVRRAMRAIESCRAILRPAGLLTDRLASELLSVENQLRADHFISKHESADLFHHTRTLDQIRGQSLRRMIPAAYGVFKHHSPSRMRESLNRAREVLSRFAPRMSRLTSDSSRS